MRRQQRMGDGFTGLQSALGGGTHMPCFVVNISQKHNEECTVMHWSDALGHLLAAGTAPEQRRHCAAPVQPGKEQRQSSCDLHKYGYSVSVYVYAADTGTPCNAPR